MLLQYCQRWGLTVNLLKTKLMLLSGARTQQEAQQIAEAAGLRFAGQPLAAVVSFKYLGIVFHSSTCLAGCAGAARALLAHKAMHDCRARCAELGIEAAPVQLQLFSTMVDSVLSHGAEVWGMQLAARAAASPASTAGSQAEQVHIRYLRQLLGVRQSTPSAVVLVEAGEQPLWLRWLRRAAKLWNSMLEAPPDSLLHQALATSRQLAAAPAAPARQPWAAQFAAAMAAAGQPVNLQEPNPVSLNELVESGQERQLQQLRAAADREGASKLRHYVQQVRGLQPDASCTGPTSALPGGSAAAAAAGGADAAAHWLPLGGRGNGQVAAPAPGGTPLPPLPARCGGCHTHDFRLPPVCPPALALGRPV